MTIKVFVEDLSSLFAKIPSFPTSVKKSRPQDHDSFTCALLELALNGLKFFMDYADHSLDLRSGNGPRSGLFSE